MQVLYLTPLHPVVVYRQAGTLEGVGGNLLHHKPLLPLLAD
jgi:hypothetical protein